MIYIYNKTSLVKHQSDTRSRSGFHCLWFFEFNYNHCMLFYISVAKAKRVGNSEFIIRSLRHDDFWILGAKFLSWGIFWSSIREIIPIVGDFQQNLKNIPSPLSKTQRYHNSISNCFLPFEGCSLPSQINPAYPCSSL